MNINEAVVGYETALNELVEGVAKFQPDLGVAEKLITSNDQLQAEIDTLKLHQQYGQKINQLKQQSDELDKQLNALLIGLSDCRRELMALPGVSEDQPQRVNAEELLKYATKITKFTHAPLRYNPQQPEHANFPWPTEDEMRRGVLAVAAAAAAATEGEGEKANEPSASNNKTTEDGLPVARRGSMDDNGHPPQQAPAQPQVLDLDLFDPDDDE